MTGRGDASLLATLPDGSTLSYARDRSRAVAAGGGARLVAALLNHVLDLSAREAARWMSRDAAAPALEIRRLAGELREIVVEGESTVIPLFALEAALDAILAVHLADDTFWLFSPHPVACRPSPGDRAFLEGLEKRARAFDEARASGAIDEATESARRRVLLAELDEAGLLDEELAIEKIYWLRTWALPTLTEIAEAARELWAYFRGAVRREQVGEEPPAKLRGARVSLDWTRKPAQKPARWTAHEWLAVCERTMMKDPSSGAEGRIFLSQGPVAAQVFWRCDDGEHPALYEALVTERA